MKVKNAVADKIAEYINSHLSEELKLDQLAALAGYSKFYLCRRFADEMGMTIHQYILKRRLAEAADNLIRSDRAIADIAADYGYDSQQAFHLAFKNCYLEAPYAYRKKHRNLEMQSEIKKNLIDLQQKKINHRLWMKQKGVLAA